jgi:chromate transporter
MSATDWVGLLAHFSMLSLMAVGGGMTVVPDMHRFLVDETAWMNDQQFSASIALAQAAPGPNILFVAVMGWQVALNQQQSMWAPALATLCLVAVVAPSATLALLASRWTRRHQDHLLVRSFHLGMAPVVMALLLSSAWFVFPWAADNLGRVVGVGLWTVCFVLFWRTKVNLALVLLVGAVLGALGWL